MIPFVLLAMVRLGRPHVRRAKGGIDNIQPLSGKEIRARSSRNNFLI